MGKSKITIGNAGGYWGDDPHALERQVKHGRLDYITIDFLAEITMSIMQKQRAKDPNAGYAKDFIPMLERVLPQLMEQGTRLITNAGGINPKACALAIRNLAQKMGLNPKIAVVYGDDILEQLPALKERGAALDNMETGESLTAYQDLIQAANIYFGAAPVAEALKLEPDIIITGRVTDTGITLAPMIHELGWSLTDYNRLAAGIVAGHILECGSQATGGNFTDWHKVPSFNEIGYPIVEMNQDGTFVITKHQGTGGLVSVDTVREQLFYEMGDPHSYLTPDVVADFSSIQLQQDGPDRVKVFGIKGQESTPFYKVSMAYSDGFKSTGTLLICGPNARAKAERFAEIFWQRIPSDQLLETKTEYFGWNACHRSLVQREDGNEILLRLGARAKDEASLRLFAKMIPSLILSGPPGVAVTSGVPKSQEVISYWPALLKKELVQPRIAYLEGLSFSKDETSNSTVSGKYHPVPHAAMTQTAHKATAQVNDLVVSSSASAGRGLHTLQTIAIGRSGDKGDTANIGIIARSDAAYAFLKEQLSAQVVKNLFQEICHGTVVRHEVPNMNGFNFLLESALGGGGTKTLAIDAQGKTYAQALLAQWFEIPDAVLRSVSHV